MEKEFNKKQHAPEQRSHTPILTVDYKQIDENSGYGDACYLDIGLSTWNKEDLSAKIWRWAYNGNRWSRQGEELPLSRVIDLAILVSAAATEKTSALSEFFQKEELKIFLQNFIKENMQDLGPKFDELRRVLQPTAQTIESTEIPNIFSFATSELSQDAMFAWLLTWADPQYKQYDLELHTTALQFIKLITGLNNIEINNIKVGRQWKHIDIWAEINNNIFLIIEDKTGTTIHDNQLETYKNEVSNEYNNHKKYFAYIKTGNEPESILKKVQAIGYRTISRKDILNCLEKYSGNNILLCDYRKHLLTLENATQSFKNQPVSQWCWNAWEGFYKELEFYKIIDDWKYVSNPSGGFLGAWWYWRTFYAGNMYLQFEQKKLCFKICPNVDKNIRSEIRNKCCNFLLKIAKDYHLQIYKPVRFGAGEYMTIAVVEPENIFGNDIIDIKSVIEKLKICEALVDKCCETLT